MTDYPKLGNGRSMLDQFWGAPGATNPQGDVLPAPIIITLDSVDMVNTALPYSLTMIVPMAKAKTAPVTRKVGDYQGGPFLGFLADASEHSRRFSIGLDAIGAHSAAAAEKVSGLGQFFVGLGDAAPGGFVKLPNAFPA